MTTENIENKTNIENTENQETPEYLNPEKAELLKELAKAQSTKERVDLFGKIMDDYGVDVVASVAPGLGDGGSSMAASLYLLAEGKRIGLSTVDSLKIFGYQTADSLVGTMPVIGDIADYFFKANKRSAKIFEKHFEKLKKQALEKGITAQEIENMQDNSSKLIEIINKNYSA